MPKGTTQPEAASLDDVLVAISAFANDTEKRFGDITEHFDAVDKRFDSVDAKIDKTRLDLESDMTALRKELTHEINKLEWKVVSRDYLDEKLHDLKGDLIMITRKEDKKLSTLVTVLQNKKVLSDQDTKLILQLEPFPQG